MRNLIIGICGISLIALLMIGLFIVGVVKLKDGGIQNILGNAALWGVFVGALTTSITGVMAIRVVHKNNKAKNELQEKK